MKEDRTAKKAGRRDALLMFLVPVLVAALLLFAASIGGNIKGNAERQVQGRTLSEEPMGPLILGGEQSPGPSLEKRGTAIETSRI